ncbi:gliding motility-associated C-terminal domain-containing protein [Mucilaginibacter myungsuensis]|uniref:Gliding motility-associated C-terminal domain-containing protein n=1 Tax=Mucilaginibacter myungsuensis TaxID=649104 RepID=A0A929KWB7_9SPHI|nr:gliding motility-associated C-terminal domain-containing protein [Mucilaginibacter myungsuensis]MBE9662816.1 gliding motility-associated C-terminal domain-containing protein [Mucilaginibacter myungsuensis]MDN3598236.1 gliding motility-associated C-terminal domain-containing protein [Mucilaginibacter myungsuensis]
MKAALACLLFVFCCIGSYAQVCTGSLGDPIVKVDFGAGPSKRSPDRFSDITNYTYTNNEGTEDGEYSIKNTTEGDHNAGWWLTTDHTGDPGGYMMVVNASNQPGEFYRQKINGLCPGTVYEFAAWVKNLLRGRNGNQPDIEFIIRTTQGDILYRTYGIPNGEDKWVQYGLNFKTPDVSSDVTLIMVNRAPGGGGNDLVLDDITFRACGPTIATSFASFTSPVQNICEGDNAEYKVFATAGEGYGDPVYQWQENRGMSWTDIPGATTLNYTINITAAVPGTYKYRLVTSERRNMGSPNCRVNSNELTVIVNRLPSATITGGNIFCEGERMVFECAYGDTYEWTFPDGTKYPLQVVMVDKSTLAHEGTYSVKITRNGCVTVTSHTVSIVPKIKANAGSDLTVCVGAPAQLNATGGISYKWIPEANLSDPNIANPIATVARTTNFIVKVTGQNDCFTYDTVTVHIDTPVTADAGPNKIIHVGQSVVLEGKTDARSFYWSPAIGLNSADSLRPIATPIQDITYTLFTSSGNPCNYTATDQVFVRVYQNVVIPNTFTPNGDGVNESWNVGGLHTYATAITQIFNRQGELVFETKGYTKPWDGTFRGKPLPAGVYYYKIDLNIGSPLQAGWVSIIR